MQETLKQLNERIKASGLHVLNGRLQEDEHSSYERSGFTGADGDVMRTYDSPGAEDRYGEPAAWISQDDSILVRRSAMPKFLHFVADVMREANYTGVSETIESARGCIARFDDKIGVIYAVDRNGNEIPVAVNGREWKEQLVEFAAALLLYATN